MRRNRSSHETVKTDVDSGAGAQLLLLVLALFLVVWLVPDAGKKHASGTEASEAETDGGDVAENEKIEPPGIWRMMNHPPGK